MTAREVFHAGKRNDLLGLETGTLMDDVDFTHSCLNWMLETHGYPQRYDLAAYREIFRFSH